MPSLQVSKLLTALAKESFPATASRHDIVYVTDTQEAPFTTVLTSETLTVRSSLPVSHTRSNETLFKAPKPHPVTMSNSDTIPALLIVLITILVPPIGVFMVAGCGADLLINICFTILGYIPGHIHAFYLEYVYFDRREKSRLGQLTAEAAPGVYSDNVNSGGTRGYGTI